MRCIFCKNNSSNSKSVEHIIPESLGNVEHILPRGIVCDKCNNYFSRKIEGKMLEQPYFKNVRFRQRLESKRGRCPPEKGFLLNPPSEVEIHIEEEHLFNVYIKDEVAAEKIPDLEHGALIYIKRDLPDKDNQIVSRFLGKVGFELLARDFSISDDALNGIIDDEKLDPLRHYVRYGTSDLIWPYNMRRIYDEDKKFFEGENEFQVLHEMTLLYTMNQELYIVLCVLGIEYCLNMGGPDLEGYFEWLKEHNNKSPLDPEFCKSINRSNYDLRKKKCHRKKFKHIY